MTTHSSTPGNDGDLRYRNVGLVANTAGAGAARYAQKRGHKAPKGGRKAVQNLNPANRRPGWVTYAFLAIVFLISIFPLFAALMYGSSTPVEMAQASGNLPRWIPSGRLLDNWWRILNHPAFSFMAAFRNSLIVATVTAASQVVFSTLAAFSFAKLRFRGKGWMYTFIIATMAIPAQIGTVP